jgi:hypothetical protein
MVIPPSIRQLMPSLVIEGGYTPSSKVTCNLTDLRAVLQTALASVEVDEEWYLRQYPDVREGISDGTSLSATEHYRNCGYFEGRLPTEPDVDEEWYKAANSDVAAGIREGRYRDARAHYIQSGYLEGRQPRPSAGRSFSRSSTLTAGLVPPRPPR